MQSFGPYSPLRDAGGSCYFISGQVGVSPDTKQASTDVREQTQQALCNMTSVLADAGLDMNDVVKTTIFLKNIDDFAAVNEVYMTNFDEQRPARSCVAVASLPKVAGDTELLVEIEAVAYKEPAV